MEETAYTQYDTVSQSAKQVPRPIIIELDALSTELTGLASTVDSLYVTLSEILGPNYPPSISPAQDTPDMSNLGNRLNSMRESLTDSNSRINSLIKRVEL